MYEERFGFTGQPFGLTPDARFYYGSASHRRAMAYLGYGLAQGEGFIVITGEIGAGKTTLVGHLMDTVDPARLTVASVATTQVGADDMLRLAATAFGLPGEGSKAALLDRVQGFVGDEARAGRRTLLIVDEAQALPHEALEELRMLSNFQSGGRALLQIFLLGQPEFRERLAGEPGLEQLRQRVIATHHLDPMDPAEIEPYMLHRLTLAGWTGEPRFDPSAFAAFHRHSGGVPRRLNLLANRALLQAAVNDSALITRDDVDAVAAETAFAAPSAETEEEDAPLFQYLGTGHEDAPEPIEEAEAYPVLTEAPAAIGANAFASPAEREWVARVQSLEARVEEQDAALRRVLTLLVDWVERDEHRGTGRRVA